MHRLSSAYTMNIPLESAFHQMHFLESGITSGWTSQKEYVRTQIPFQVRGRVECLLPSQESLI